MGSALSSQQDQAVRAEGHLLVTSCPGSGKTTVLSHRAEHLLRTHPKGSVGAVTFTSDAADELQARIRARVGNVGNRLITGTFHKMAIRQLKDAKLAFKLISEFKARDIIRSGHMLYAASAFKLEETAEAITRYKSEPDYPLPSPDQDVRVRVYRYYQEKLSAAGEMDFADLLLRVIYGMRTGEVAPLPVTHLLADEFQDADGAQLEWIKAHMAAGIEVTCVGDDDQSIFGWRSGLGVAGLRRFMEAGRANQIVLDTTYRCAPEVLGAAARLIGRNQDRIAKRLRTESSAEGVVAMQGHQSRRSEYAAVIEAVLDSGAPEQWGILARTNALLDGLEEELAMAFPYTRVGSESVWEMVGPQLMLGVLGAIAANSFSGIDTLLGRCGIAPIGVDAITDRVQPRVLGSLMRFMGLRNGELVTSKGDLACEVRDFVREWTELVDSGRLRQAMCGMAAFIATRVRWSGSATASAERIKAERERLERCGERISRMTGSLAEILAQLRRKDKDVQTRGARLMTLHASKGLEFDRVWILGAEQGVLPSTKGDLEEERRLMYVGITRARTWLTISYARENGARPSDFIEEAGIYL